MFGHVLERIEWTNVVHPYNKVLELVQKYWAAWVPEKNNALPLPPSLQVWGQPMDVESKNALTGGCP